MSSVTAESQDTSPLDPSTSHRLSLTQRAYAALLRRLERWLGLHLVWIFRRTLVPPPATPHAEGAYSFRELTASGRARRRKLRCSDFDSAGRRTRVFSNERRAVLCTLASNAPFGTIRYRRCVETGPRSRALTRLAVALSRRFGHNRRYTPLPPRR
jgi:hypothetical protein